MLVGSCCQNFCRRLLHNFVVLMAANLHFYQQPESTHDQCTSKWSSQTPLLPPLMSQVYVEQVLLFPPQLFCRVKNDTLSGKRFLVFLLLIIAFSHDLQCVEYQFYCIFLVQTSVGLWAVFSKWDFDHSWIRSTSQPLMKTRCAVHPRLA